MADNWDLSNSISDVLDWVGLSQDEVQWQIKVWKRLDSLMNAMETIISGDLVRITGSRAEGIGLDILGADVDIMFCDKSACLILSCSDWNLLPGVVTFLVETNDVHPGYCRLILMNRNVPTFINTDKRDKSLVLFKGLLLLSNNIQFSDIGVASQHGPAETIKNTDNVHCFHSNWPPCAREWIDRDRPSNFPSLNFVQEAERRGVKVVPTGHKRSKHANTEWQFSFSFIELDLVHMWPNTALKCYVLLKLLKKSITLQLPHLIDTLCSYHLKTLLFWLTEETGLEYWRTCSLMECLLFSLQKLLCWIECGWIPHYFVKSNNLFDNDVGTSRQTDLVTTIRAMLERQPCLLHCESYKHWCRELSKACPSRDSFFVMKERSSLHFRIAGFLHLKYMTMSVFALNWCD